MGVYVKAFFGVVAAALYCIGAYQMIDGALHTAAYAPGEPAVYLATACGAGITAFVAAQLGIAIASGSAGGSLVARLKTYSEGSTGTAWVTTGILIVDLLALTVFGFLFVWLWVSPGNIAVAPGQDPLTAAPEYISVQAKAFIALVLAGAAGVGVAATK